MFQLWELALPSEGSLPLEPVVCRSCAVVLQVRLHVLSLCADAVVVVAAAAVVSIGPVEDGRAVCQGA